jgi:HD-GYP domain-containing protein (c-di-GMP phosphodiesterase class II)
MVSPQGEVRTPSAEFPTRAEVLAALSVAIDLGLGQPAEHMLRSALIATRIADRLRLSRDQRDGIYYTTLIMWIGCHADSAEYARWFGDDIAVRHDAYLVDWSGLPYLRFLATNVGRGEPLMHRLNVMASLLINARGQLSKLIHSHCMSAALLAERIGLGPDVQAAVAFTFERYDGGGLPTGAHGDEIPMQMRVAQVADLVEVYQRTLDPLLIALGDFVDLKLPFTLGHSRSVARRSCVQPLVAIRSLLQRRRPRVPGRRAGQDCFGVFDKRVDHLGVELAAASAARHVHRTLADAAIAAGLDTETVELMRRAGHVHDLGRIGISNQIWSKPGPLTAAEFERVRLHPYLTVRILSQVPGLERMAQAAGNHHERVGGSGYPRGLAGTALSRRDRLLAAAVSYQSACEPRPYREALSPDAAARRLRDRVRAGALDPAAADAVLHAAGHRAQRPNVVRPNGLTPREIEVLCLVARGASNKQIAASLVISEQTVRNHVERTYAKIGVSNRIDASMYALQHGLVAPAVS